MDVNRRTLVGGLAATILPLRQVDASQVEADKPKAISPQANDGFTLVEARGGSIRLLPTPAPETEIWGYGGQVPGPLIRVKKGQEVKVRLVNKLTQPTSLCWHGVRIVNAMDGVAGLTQKPVQPGETFDYRFTPPDSGLYWYHPHVFPVGAEQIGRGLYGVLIVDEPEPPPVDEDLLVVLDDWSLDDKGRIRGDFLDTEQALHAGHIGSLVTLDSRPVPTAAKTVRPGARIRLRLLNACSARIALVSFEGVSISVIAIDGQPSEIFRPARETIPIGPGSRFELMFDLPADAGAQATLVLRGDGAPDQPLMTVKTLGAPVAARDPVAKLPANPLLPTRIPLERSLKRTLVIGGGAKLVGAKPVGATPEHQAGTAAKPRPELETSRSEAPSAGTSHLWTLDGVASDGFSAKPIFSVKRGTAVTLAFANKTDFAQQMHVHGHAWRILHDLDDGWDPYWRDSVLIAPGKTKHVAFIADNPGRWVIESLIRDRQETGLAAHFDVT